MVLTYSLLTIQPLNKRNCISRKSCRATRYRWTDTDQFVHTDQREKQQSLEASGGLGLSSLI